MFSVVRYLLFVFFFPVYPHFTFSAKHSLSIHTKQSLYSSVWMCTLLKLLERRPAWSMSRTDFIKVYVYRNMDFSNCLACKLYPKYINYSSLPPSLIYIYKTAIVLAKFSKHWRTNIIIWEKFILLLQITIFCLLLDRKGGVHHTVTTVVGP